LSGGWPTFMIFDWGPAHPFANGNRVPRPSRVLCGKGGDFDLPSIGDRAERWRFTASRRPRRSCQAEGIQNPRPFDKLRAGSVAENATRNGAPDFGESPRQPAECLYACVWDCAGSIVTYDNDAFRGDCAFRHLECRHDRALGKESFFTASVFAVHDAGEAFAVKIPEKYWL
jgi:hypothetical protein